MHSSLVILIVLSAVRHPAVRRMDGTRWGDYVGRLSKGLMKFFVIQWLLIGYSLCFSAIFSLPRLPLELVVPVGVLYTVAALILFFTVGEKVKWKL